MGLAIRLCLLRQLRVAHSAQTPRLPEATIAGPGSNLGMSANASAEYVEANPPKAFHRGPVATMSLVQRPTPGSDDDMKWNGSLAGTGTAIIAGRSCRAVLNEEGERMTWT